VPQKKGRQSFFKELNDAVLPCVFFESTHRIMKTLETLVQETPEKNLVVAREITKLHEEIVRDIPAKVLEYFTRYRDHQKGEFVLILY
jgi:16S rRNA (cytidine1402-2'-O)-methyltransferase